MWWSFSVLCFLRLQNSLHIGVSWWVLIRPCSLPTGPKVTFILPPLTSSIKGFTVCHSAREPEITLAWGREPAGACHKETLLREDSVHIIGLNNPRPLGIYLPASGSFIYLEEGNETWSSRLQLTKWGQSIQSWGCGEPSIHPGWESHQKSPGRDASSAGMIMPGRHRAAKTWPPFCSPRDPILLLGWQSLRPEVGIMK